MSLLPGKKRALHQPPRHAFDWYRETRESVESLFDAVRFDGAIHDPACGLGRIIEVAHERGYQASGSDIADYGFGEAGVDFLTDHRPRDSLVFNAPYKDNERFIRQGFEVARYQIAALVRIPFLAGQERYRELFAITPPNLVLVLSRRPSMPPGNSDSPAKNDTADYCWLIWPERTRRRCGKYKTTLAWAKP
jgi:hypothetical protein